MERTLLRIDPLARWRREPWIRYLDAGDGVRHLSPDFMFQLPSTGVLGLVEVKLNYRRGREKKLLTSYLQAAEKLFPSLRVLPILATRNPRNSKMEARLSLERVLASPTNPYSLLHFVR